MIILLLLTGVAQLASDHRVTIAFNIAFNIEIDAVLVDAALARVLVVVCVVGTSPEIPGDSVAITPPRFLHTTKPQRCAETVVLYQQQ